MHGEAYLANTADWRSRRALQSSYYNERNACMCFDKGNVGGAGKGGYKAGLVHSVGLHKDRKLRRLIGFKSRLMTFESLSHVHLLQVFLDTLRCDRNTSVKSEYRNNKKD